MKYEIDPNHCYECAGQAKQRGETCNTCDGEGNLKEVKPTKKKAK